MGLSLCILLGQHPVDEDPGQPVTAFALRHDCVIAAGRLRRLGKRPAQHPLLQQVIHKVLPAYGHALPGNRGLDQQGVVVESQLAGRRGRAELESLKQSVPVKPLAGMFAT